MLNNNKTMANKKNKLGRPTKASGGLNFKVRFKPEQKGGYFIVTDRKRKRVSDEKFNNPEKALVVAKELHEATFKK